MVFLFIFIIFFILIITSKIEIKISDFIFNTNNIEKKSGCRFNTNNIKKNSDYSFNINNMKKNSARQSDIISSRGDLGGISGRYKITVKMKILKNITILKFNIDKTRLNLIKKYLIKNEKLEGLKKKIMKNKDEDDINILKIINDFNRCVNIKKLNMKLEFGIENAFITAIFIAIFSTCISVWVSRLHIGNDKIIYEVKPIYINQNYIKFEIFGIFQINLIHIINIIYVLNKK